jgi:squalene cyclase
MFLQGERMKEANWKDLCEAIVEESDSQKLISLVHQLNEVLDGGNFTLQPENDAKGE